MKLCDYGCGQEAKYPFKNGKWCCSKSQNSCPEIRKKNSIQIKEAWNDPNNGLNLILYNREEMSNIKKKAHKDPNSKYNSISCREKHSNTMKDIWADPNSVFNSIKYIEKRSKATKQQSNIIKELWEDPNSIYNSITCKAKQSKSHKLTIEKINKKYPFFSKIEEMRYNPDKPKEKEIQVHCKNHECENSKEKGSWFTVTKNQLFERLACLEAPKGFGESNFYCSQQCKNTCSLYGIQSDPYKNNNLPYTYAEYQTCRTIVLERENGLCEYCGEPATDMHHIFPVKLEPFFALDPDYCVACCEKHHYKYAHKDECSTGNLSKIVCSVESQKFLNQTL